MINWFCNAKYGLTWACACLPYIQKQQYNLYNMRSILLRAFRKSTPFMPFRPAFSFATVPPTGQKKNIFKMPLPYEFEPEALDMVQQYILNARSCNILAVTLRDNMTLFTEGHLWKLYKHLRQSRFTVDNSFHQIIAPISLEYLKVFTRENAVCMYQMMLAMLQLKIENTQLWDALIKKLDTENCYRYIPQYETALLLNRLLDNEASSKLPLTRKLITVIHQQKEYYNHFSLTRPVVKEILAKVEKLQMEEPQLSEAFKQLK